MVKWSTAASGRLEELGEGSTQLEVSLPDREAVPYHYCIGYPNPYPYYYSCILRCFVPPAPPCFPPATGTSRTTATAFATYSGFCTASHRAALGGSYTSGATCSSALSLSDLSDSSSDVSRRGTRVSALSATSTPSAAAMA